MARISKADMFSRLVRVANLMKSADGKAGTRKNNVISRAELAKLGETLKGYEKGVFMLFSSFIDHRDQRAITFKDVDRALEYAREKLIARLDKNKNGLSMAELALGSLTARLLANWIKAEPKLSDADTFTPAQKGGQAAQTSGQASQSGQAAQTGQA
jgi:hypothetical protein